MAKPNSDYGKGVFRRRIFVRGEPGVVKVELEDGNHGFRVRLAHDGETVTDLTVDTVRYPFNTCPEAITPLRRIVGFPLDGDAQALRDRAVPGENCTHMFDMAALAIAHARQEDLALDYLMAVEDQGDGPARVEIHCNGQVFHAWTVKDHVVVSPPALAGKPMMRGFHAWASRAFDAPGLEAATALQRAYFVAQSRRHDFDPPEANPGIGDGMPQGCCYSYNHGAVERALRSAGTVRDFTRTPEKLLRFEP